MILPFFRGIQSFQKAPMTWLIIIINGILMGFTLTLGKSSQIDMEDILTDANFSYHQGQFYAQYIEAHEESYGEVLQKLSKIVLSGDSTKAQLLGGTAFRDDRFLDEQAQFIFRGDQVALQLWREKLNQWRNMQKDHPSFALGLNSQNMGYLSWISYQFIHSGIFHFMGNMIFLLLFGCVLEPLIGGAALLVIYVCSGMVAGGVFLLVNGVTQIPLVGASGAVSGLMALSCILLWRRPVKYFYFLFILRKGFFGFVFLPAWLTLLLWILTDLGGYLSSLKVLGGVAFSAHLGGEAAGILVGLLFFMLKFHKKGKVLDESLLPETGAVGTTTA